MGDGWRARQARRAVAATLDLRDRCLMIIDDRLASPLVKMARSRKRQTRDKLGARMRGKQVVTMSVEVLFSAPEVALMMTATHKKSCTETGTQRWGIFQ